MQIKHNSKAEARRYYTKLRSEGKFHGAITTAVQKWERRSRNRLSNSLSPGRFAAIHARNVQRMATPVAVPLGAEQASKILARIRDRDRRMIWSSVSGAVQSPSIVSHTSGSNSDWKRRSTFDRWATVQSQATCTRHEATLLFCGDKFTIKAPRGYRWDRDSHGLLLRGTAGDYHPTADELINASEDRCKAIVAKLKELAALRRTKKREARLLLQAAKAKKIQQEKMLKLAEKEGATVCLADSLRAGNCRAGSLAWASRHGFVLSQHYRPSEVLAKANGDMQRVAIVVATALRRHRTEMERGYALLAEHTA